MGGGVWGEHRAVPHHAPIATAMSLHITLMDCAMCSAWLSGVFASLSITAEKSEVEASELGCVSMRFHRGSPVPGEPATSARFSAMRERMPG